MTDFEYGQGHRWWLDSRKCPHDNGNVCRLCDHDRYYARTYETCPWGEDVDD